MDSIHRDSTSSLENCEILSSIYSSFTSKDDLTFYSSSVKIKFGSLFFEHHLLAVASDLESIRSANCEDSLSDNKLEDPSIDIEFESFIMPHSEDTIFEDDLTTSSVIKGNIVTSSRIISINLN